MITGGNATLVVSDVNRAVRFYVETLGFKLREGASDAWAAVDAGDGLVIGLARGSASEPSPAFSIGLDVNQPIAEVVAVLANRGVTFSGPPHEEAGVKRAFFTDPDGNTLYLAERSPTAGSRSSARS